MRRTYKLYSTLTELEQSKTWAEIDLSALRHNYRLICDKIRSQTPEGKVIAVVKAEAYGHGAPECVRVLLSEGCGFFAVSCIDEAIAVRRVCDAEGKDAEVLILGFTQPELAPELARYRITQALLSEEYAVRMQKNAADAGVTVLAHVALDTGMNRIGFPSHGGEELAGTVASIERVAALPNLSLTGMFTHYARADESPDGEGERLTDAQTERFRAIRDGLERAGVRIPFLHTCNSAAAIRRPADYFDGVRVGILLYGARPSEKFDLPLEPVMKLRTVISHLHRLLPGEAVGYGGTFTADEERLIATMPIGYGDGFLRAYSGAFVTVETAGGARTAPIVGRVCMDQCMIDVTGLGAKEGDTVTLFGQDPKELSALAARAGTIDYECLCLISSRVKRNYKDAGKRRETDAE